MVRALCITFALVVFALPAPAHADDVCVLVSPGSKKTAPLYDAVARAVLEKVRGVRIDGDDLRDAAALQKSCRRVAIAIGVKALQAAHAHLDGLPTVYTLAQAAEQVFGDHPNLYGVSASADPGPLLDTLHEIAPAVKRIGVVYNPRRTGALVTLAKSVAAGRDLELVALEVPDKAAAIKAFHRFEKEIAVDALWLLPDNTVLAPETVQYALRLALWARLPVIGPSLSYVQSGALFALTPDPRVQGHLAADIAKRLLRGERPPSFQFASKHHLVLSQRMADKLGCRLPPQLVRRAEELIR